MINFIFQKSDGSQTVKVFTDGSKGNENFVIVQDPVGSIEDFKKLGFSFVNGVVASEKEFIKFATDNTFNLYKVDENYPENSNQLV